MPLSTDAQLNQYQPQFDAVTGRYGLPRGLLRAIAQVESGGNRYAQSSANAVGLMQFMPGTAARYGLKDRTDPNASIDAAGRYLIDLRARFGGDWDAVIGAYNAGEGRMQQYLNSRGEGRNQVNLPPETRAYIPRVRAAWARGTGGNEPDSQFEQGWDSVKGMVGDALGTPWWWPTRWSELFGQLAAVGLPLVAIVLVGVGLLLSGFGGLV